MISLRGACVASSIFLGGALFVACGTSDLTTPIAPGTTATADKDGDHRNPTPCPMATRVVIDAQGNAVLEVRSGTFDQVTNIQAPFGKLTRVHYVVSSAAGIVLLDADVKVAPPNPLFTTPITVLSPPEKGKRGKTTTPPVLFDATDNVVVTATIDRPGEASKHDDANDANNLAGPCTATSAAEIVKPADLSVGPFERVMPVGTNLVAPDFGDASPASTQTFSLTVNSPLHSLPASATCSATVTSAGGTSYPVQWVTQQLQLLAGTSQSCQFTVSFPDPGTFTVVATATSVGDPNSGNNSSTGTIVVRPPGETIDVFVRSIQMDLGGGATGPLGQFAADAPAQYVAAIGVTPGVGNQTSSPVLCSVKVTNARTATFVTVPGTVTGIASTTTDALCRFSLTLAGNGDLDENYQIAVTAQPAAALDANAANNTLAATQTAIVRVDVAVMSVTMTVDGVIQGGLGTIPQGKTANYLVTFINNSARAAAITCNVTAGSPGTTPVPLPLVNTPSRITIAAGGTATCSFAFVFSLIVAENFTVTADNVLPIDEDPANNVFSFQTVSQSDHTFPAIDFTNVSAIQTWVTDQTGTPTVLNAQRTSINRITLTFAATSAILGDFKLTGTVTTDGRPVSSGTWTVPGLHPGQNGFPNCVAGVDPGFTAVNNHVLTLKICAQEVAGQPGVQAIFVEYDSNMPTAINMPDPQTMFGSTITFNVALDWTLFGTQVPDHASALLEFGLANTNTGTPNVYQITSTGAVTVVRNGG